MLSHKPDVVVNCNRDGVGERSMVGVVLLVWGLGGGGGGEEKIMQKTTSRGCVF